MPPREADSSRASRGGGNGPAPSISLRPRLRRAAVPVLLLLLSSCRAAPVPGPPAPEAAPRMAAPFPEKLLDLVERRTFDYFWDLANPANGLVPDRAPTKSFSSIAAVGF